MLRNMDAPTDGMPLKQEFGRPSEDEEAGQPDEEAVEAHSMADEQHAVRHADGVTLIRSATSTTGSKGASERVGLTMAKSAEARDPNGNLVGCFATALGKWLVAAAAESPAPLAAAHLLGVALRSLRDAPGHAGERLYIACLQLLTRLLDAGPAPHAEGIARRAVEGARLPAGREAGLLAVLAARARE